MPAKILYVYSRQPFVVDKSSYDIMGQIKKINNEQHSALIIPFNLDMYIFDKTIYETIDKYDMCIFNVTVDDIKLGSTHNQSIGYQNQYLMVLLGYALKSLGASNIVLISDDLLKYSPKFNIDGIKHIKYVWTQIGMNELGNEISNYVNN